MSLNLEQLQSVITAMPDPIFVLTESGKYAGVFGGGDPRYYHDGSILAGKSLYDVLPKEKADWFLKELSRSLKEDRLCTVEYGLSADDVEGLDGEAGPDGEIWFEGRIQPLPFSIDSERAVVWTARNITERHVLEQELQQKSERDELTGAYNRRKLMSELEEHYYEFHRYSQPSSLLMLDADHFKTVNDNYGHAAGDKVLRDVVNISMLQLRDVDIFSRFGGEEFVVLLPHTPLDEAKSTAERLRKAIATASIIHADSKIDISFSIGVSSFIEKDVSFEAILKRADDAMYQAKHKGRNCVVVA